MGLDYYKVLGIDKSASEDDIKKAYKRMALRWHPDRNQGSEEADTKFKEISEAFEVLNDPQKRTVYDQFGEEGLKGGGGPPPGAAGGFPAFNAFPGGTSFTFTSGGPGGFARSGGFTASDPRKVFEEIFSGGGLGGFGGFGGSGGRSGMFGVDEDDDMGGGYGSFSSFGGMPGGLGGMGSMGGMSGMGGVPRGRRGGPSGFRPAAAARNASRSKKEPNEITRPLRLSLNDLYSGTTKRLKIGRRLLDGSTEDKVLEIHVSPGWKSGTKIRFPKAGNEQPGGEAQDLVFIVEDKPHGVFRREGNDLIATVKVSLVDALCGPPGSQRLTKVLELLDGRKLQVPPPSMIIKPGSETRVPGEGMPIRKEGSAKSKGDLIVKWDVEFPERLTQEQKDRIREILA